MTEKDQKSTYVPDFTNYDYIWGSDQDEYVRQVVSSEDDSSEQQETLQE